MKNEKKQIIKPQWEYQMSSFADLMKQQKGQIKKNHNGSLVDGKVTGSINLKGIQYFVVDAGLKYEGIVAASEIAHFDHSKEIQFMIIGEKEHHILLSYDKARRELNLKHIRKFYDNKDSVNIKIVAQTNDGYKVVIFNETPGVLLTKEAFEVGTEIKAYVVRIFSNGNINLALEPSNTVKMKEGDIVNGHIISFNDYFVFVEVENTDMEGIVHFQDLSWEKINFPGEIIQQGQHLKLKILKIQNNRCMYLGLKQMQHNPWNDLKGKLEIGQICEGTVKNINDYELIINLGHGLTGAVHVSEASWGFKKGSSLAEDFAIDQHIKCKVIDIDSNKRKIKLSIKQLLPNPFFEFCKIYQAGDTVEGTILHDSTAYGSFIFVELIPGVDGMLHQSEMDWHLDDGIAKFNGLDKGEKIKVQITNIDQEKMRVSVSVKRLNPDFFELNSKSAQIGKIYDVEVISVGSDGLDVKIKDFPLCNAFIKKNELSYDKNIRIGSFSVGGHLKAKLTAIHNLKRSFLLSVKAMQQDENRDAIKKNQNSFASSSFGSFIDQ
jgi:small subunit ribosomal protein S1